MKKCSACAEEIQDEASKCRFCGEKQKPIISRDSVTSSIEEINSLLSSGDRKAAFSIASKLQLQITGAANCDEFPAELQSVQVALATLRSKAPARALGLGIMITIILVCLFIEHGREMSEMQRHIAAHAVIVSAVSEDLSREDLGKLVEASTVDLSSFKISGVFFLHRDRARRTKKVLKNIQISLAGSEEYLEPPQPRYLKIYWDGLPRQLQDAENASYGKSIIGLTDLGLATIAIEE